MSKLFFAKFNINSNINQIDDNEINTILGELYNKIDDKKEYIKDIPYKFINEEGEEIVGFSEEIYNFTQIEKNKEKKIITGFLVRRMNTQIEEFDEKKRIAIPKVLDNTAASTMFYIDMEKEIITFTTRQRLGHLQIQSAFEGLFNRYMEEIGFKVFLILNPFEIDEIVDKMKKIHKIQATFIPPNAANRSAMEKLMNKKAQELKDSNVTSETVTLESDRKNKVGINKKSQKFEEIVSFIKTFLPKGYGETILEGENNKGDFMKVELKEQAPYTTNISEANKNDRLNLIKQSEDGINNFSVRETLKNLDH